MSRRLDFEQFVIKGPGCWLWARSDNVDGYAVYGGRLVHRLMYERHRGPIPVGKTLDHFECDRRGCVNPDHRWRTCSALTVPASRGSPSLPRCMARTTFVGVGQVAADFRHAVEVRLLHAPSLNLRPVPAPLYVRPASRRENILRGDTLAARNLAKRECRHGHPFTPENTYVDRSGRRHCRICQRGNTRRWHEKQTGGPLYSAKL